jgi:tRNA pseudouridine32 synthase/23S rRNA pseudouridine746 synthase
MPRMKHSPWPTVLEHLVERLPGATREQWVERMQRGAVLGEDGQPIPLDAAYAHGQRVYYWRELPQEDAIPFSASIVFEDELLVVADKPHFLPVTPGGRYLQETLLVRLKAQLACPELSPLHRIDRETAGLVLLCKRPQDRHAYQLLFRERRIHKRYEAVAAVSEALQFPLVRSSRIEEDPAQFFRMHEVAGEANSETRIHLLDAQAGRGLYALEPVTGKRHQLRVHMNALGLPLEGDQFYPVVRRQPDEPEDFQVSLQLLARHLAFTDPITSASRTFSSGLQLHWP